MWIASPKPLSDPLTVLCLCGFTCSLVGANTGGCQVNAAVFTEWHWFTRCVQFTEEKKIPQAAEYPGNCGAVGPANSGANGLVAAESHGGRVTHLCGAAGASQLRQRQVEQKVHAEARRRYGTCARPRKPWIGKITITPLRFLKTHVPTRDHTGRTTATARRPASTWAGRCTPPTHRRPWEPWSRPACLTLAPLTVYKCGRTRHSSTILRGSSSSLSSPPRAMGTRGNRADTTSRSPGWKPPNLTHTPGRDSGQVTPPNLPRESHWMNGELRFFFFFIVVIELSSKYKCSFGFQVTNQVSFSRLSGLWWHHAPNNMILGVSVYLVSQFVKRPGRSALAFIRSYRHKKCGVFTKSHILNHQSAPTTPTSTTKVSDRCWLKKGSFL